MLGFRQRWVLKAVKQLAESVLADDEILERQLAVIELNLVKVLAAHRVIGAGDREPRRAAFEQDASDPLAPGAPVDPAEDHEHARLRCAAYQRLRAVENHPVAL